MTSRAYKENYQLIDWKPLARPAPRREIPPARSHLAAPMVILDTMPPVQSQATGQMYDSKAAIRAEYKRLGLQEVGNDPSRFKKKEKRKPDVKAIKDALDKAEARFKRGERAFQN